MLAPRHETRENVEIIWQIPAEPRAVLFIAHSGGSRPAAYWDPHPGCKACVGLPEHVAIVMAALRRRYAVIAIKSSKDFWQEWPPEASEDCHNVSSILSSWTKEHMLQHLPLVALGSASGGRFVSALARLVSISALVVMVSTAAPQALVSNPFPPTLFIHMPKDSLTARKITDQIRFLSSRNSPVSEITCLDFPIHPCIFSSHMPGVSPELSEKIFLSLVDSGISTPHGCIMAPVSLSDLRKMLHRDDILPLLHSPLSEDNFLEFVHSILRVAEGRHAVTGRKCQQMFDWLDSYT